MPFTINGTSGLTFPDSTTQATRAVSRSGDTMTGALGINGSSVGRFGSGLSVKGTIPEVHLSRNDGNGEGIMLLDNNASSRRLFIGTSGTDPVHLGANGTTHIAIDSSGRVTMPLQPAFSASMSGSTVLASSKVPFNSPHSNIGNHFNTSTNTFTAPVTGSYLFYAHVRVETSGATTNYCRAVFFKNSVAFAPSNGHLNARVNGNYSGHSTTCLMYLSANDSVYVHFENGNSVTMPTTGSENLFCGYLVG